MQRNLLTIEGKLNRGWGTELRKAGPGGEEYFDSETPSDHL